MKKNLLMTCVLIFSFAYAQEQKIDFSRDNFDLKHLTLQQKEEYLRWRDGQMRLLKTAGDPKEKKSVIIQGNKIHTIIYNTGAISTPTLLKGNTIDLVWNGLGYGYEFSPLVAARVPKLTNPLDSVSIVIDGLESGGDFAPGNVIKWGWLPKPGYSAPGQNDVATWGARTSDLRIRPSSWPESWYNSILGIYVYPSFLGGNTSVPDEEVYYVVDDSTDKEFISSYQPMPSNPEHGGLGINLEVRTMQFANPLAEDIMFLVYTAENDGRSKAIPNMFFGMFGDPHIGGYTDYNDDAASFIPARPVGIPAFDKLLTVGGKLTSQLSRNIVYSWDPDGKSMIAGLAPGYFGYKFLESPNNSTDGIDNDDDGIIDESPFNDKGFYIDGVTKPLTTGINDVAKYTALYGAPKPRWSGDENGNWNVENDDVGIDGIPATADSGEGDGVPSQKFYQDINGNGKYDIGEPVDDVQHDGWGWAGSEPNFGFRDVTESDQIGLRSFWSLVYGQPNSVVRNDIAMYNYISSAYDTSALTNLYTTNTNNTGDYIFLYGCGPFEMQPGHRERFSIALLLGQDLPDLLLNSETAQLVMQASYRFAQPPAKPKVTVVPGNGRVTLYWDNNSENSIDPFTLKKDFEGYKIYRSQDYTFKDVFSITDANGYAYLGKALYDTKARKTAQWHRPWTATEQNLYAGGFMPVEYMGRYIKYYMGEPTDTSGLVHQYVDSTVTNGVTYYYAVVAFDHGDDTLKIPPSETQSIIQQNAVTQAFKFDVNTAVAVPNAMADGIISPKTDLEKGITIAHKTGFGTGIISFKVLDEQTLGDNVYQVKFDSIVVGSAKTIAYSVRRYTPVIEQFVGNNNLPVTLANSNIVGSAVKIYNGLDTNAAPISLSLVTIDSAKGRIQPTGTDILLKTKTYTVSYQYYPVVLSLYVDGKDANPVFDGLRPFVVNDTLKVREYGFLPQSGLGNVSSSLKPSSVAAITKKSVPRDFIFEFTNALTDTLANGDYANSTDSAKLVLSAGYVKIPFKVSMVDDTTKPVILVYNEVVKRGNKKGRWDLGEEILLAYRGTSVPLPSKFNIYEDVLLARQVDSLSASIPVGSKFKIIMQKPFGSDDAFEFTAKALTYDANKANADLNNVIVVPNPYVVYSSFEKPSYSSDLRGERVMQFRNLPRECTIRIYTITGELVRTLYKNDNSNYYNWDLLSSESARIGYGLYIYHIETPSGGKKIGRLGIIK